jgi:hypothetical protein
MLAVMTHADSQWGLSNPGPDTLLVWLEPWAEEFEVPVRSTVAMKGAGGRESEVGEIEFKPDHLVVWASAQTVEVFIDGAFQESASASIPVPAGLSKAMLGIVFADHPAARLGGSGFPASKRMSWFERVRRRFGLGAPQ